MPSNKFLFAAILVIAGSPAFVAMRRTPACGGDGKIMSDAKRVRELGASMLATCNASPEKARAAWLCATPSAERLTSMRTKSPTSIEAPDGGFHPKLVVCLRASAEERPEPSLEMRDPHADPDRMEPQEKREVRSTDGPRRALLTGGGSLAPRDVEFDGVDRQHARRRLDVYA